MINDLTPATLTVKNRALSSHTLYNPYLIGGHYNVSTVAMKGLDGESSIYEGINHIPT